MEITRQQIISKIKDRFESEPAVYAFWLEGADALGTVDEFSDIDIWLDVEDGEETAVFRVLEGCLSEIGELDCTCDGENPHPQIRQRFYHLKGSSKFLIVDVCIQSHSRDFRFTSGFEGEKALVVFDKANVVKYCDLDQPAFSEDLEKQLSSAVERFGLRRLWVEKEIARGRFPEAFGYYIEIVGLLITVLRIKYAPTKHDFGFKHLSMDLPKELVNELDNLLKVASLAELRFKLQRAQELFELAVDNNHT